MDDERKKKYDVDLKYRMKGKPKISKQKAALTIFALPFKYIAA